MHRVAAAALVRDGQVLLCHRRADRAWYPDAWDLPGGHVEDGESPHDTLVRECREELGVTVRAATPAPVRTDDPDLDLAAFVVTAWDGEPANRAPEEHDRLGWFDARACAALPLADPRLLPLLFRALGA